MGVATRSSQMTLGGLVIIALIGQNRVAEVKRDAMITTILFMSTLPVVGHSCLAAVSCLFIYLFITPEGST